MHFSTTVASLATLAGAAMAIVPKDDRASMTVGAGVSLPTPKALDSKHRRGIDGQCTRSISSFLAAPTPADDVLPDLSSAYVLESDLCVVTMASSLSSDYDAWVSDVRDYYSTIVSKAEGIHTKCGADTFSVDVINDVCSTALTAYYTGSADQTATKTQDAISVETTTIYLGGAARQNGVLNTAVGIAVVLGAFLAL